MRHWFPLLQKELPFRESSPDESALSCPLETRLLGLAQKWGKVQLPSFLIPGLVQDSGSGQFPARPSPYGYLSLRGPRTLRCRTDGIAATGRRWATHAQYPDPGPLRQPAATGPSGVTRKNWARILALQKPSFIAMKTRPSGISAIPTMPFAGDMRKSLHLLGFARSSYLWVLADSGVVL